MKTKPPRFALAAVMVGCAGLAVGGMTIVLVDVPESIASSGPAHIQREVRTLGAGPTYSNYTLQNNTLGRVDEWAFEFTGLDSANILQDYTNTGWSASRSSSGKTAIITWTGSSAPINKGDFGHFGYQLTSDVWNVGADKGTWRSVGTGALTSYNAATLNNFHVQPLVTVTPSATPTSGPGPVSLSLHQRNPLRRLTLAGTQPRRAAQRDGPGYPPWVTLSITNTWSAPESGDPRAQTILIQRYVKILPSTQEVRLESLIEDDPLVAHALLIDPTPRPLALNEGELLVN